MEDARIELADMLTEVEDDWALLEIMLDCVELGSGGATDELTTEEMTTDWLMLGVLKAEEPVAEETAGEEKMGDWVAELDGVSENIDDTWVLNVDGDNMVVETSVRLCTVEQRLKLAWHPFPQYASDEPLP
jgi:hypothetical protein